MIRLRRTLERGRAHPILGPIVLVVLALLLAMVFLHAAHEGDDAVAQTGVLCLAILSILGPLLLGRIRRDAPAAVVETPGDRGPPHALVTRTLERLPEAAFTVVTPLRR